LKTSLSIAGDITTSNNFSNSVEGSSLAMGISPSGYNKINDNYHQILKDLILTKLITKGSNSYMIALNIIYL